MHPVQNNLTALRWLAAILVFYGHAFHFMNIDTATFPLFMNWVPLGPLGVYIFFIISGYLIAQSWDSDPHILRFLTRRALRIFPSLMVVTTLSVFVLGVVFTNLPLPEYFSNITTWGYFTNIALYITYNLPGVFENNHYPYAINGSLWSLPAEFAMYLSLMLMGVLRIPRFGTLTLTVGLMILSEIWAKPAQDMLIFYRTDMRQLVIYGVYFWMGVTFCRYDISRFFTLSNVCIAVIAWLTLSRWTNLFILGSWLFLPFIVLAFGLATGSRLALLTKLDYSYGIYVYAFPVQQSFSYVWPKMPFGLYLVTTFALTLTCAATSWHFIEKPALSLKPKRRSRQEQHQKSFSSFK